MLDLLAQHLLLLLLTLCPEIQLCILLHITVSLVLDARVSLIDKSEVSHLVQHRVASTSNQIRLWIPKQLLADASLRLALILLDLPMIIIMVDVRRELAASSIVVHDVLLRSRWS